MQMKHAVLKHAGGASGFFFSCFTRRQLEVSPPAAAAEFTRRSEMARLKFSGRLRFVLFLSGHIVRDFLPVRTRGGQLGFISVTVDNGGGREGGIGGEGRD